MKTFNTAGPVRPDDHYTVPALARWDMDEIRRLIVEERYFVLHAPRQTGKTRCDSWEGQVLGGWWWS